MGVDAVPDLAPAHVGTLAAQKHFGDTSFPLVLTSSSDDKTDAFEDIEAVETWIKKNQDKLQQAALQHGAILFRDFPVKTAEDFDIVSKAMGLEEFPYIGGAAPRTVITGSVFTANESPADQLIPYHHELAQSKNHPGTLFFFCLKPPSRGGETPICLSQLVYERIQARFPDFVKELEDKGVKYVRVLPVEDDRTSAIGRGWQSTFLTTDKDEAERLGRELGMELEWLADGSLRTVSPTLPATKVDLRTGRTSWFNSIVAAFTGWKDSRNDPTKAVIFGDGSPLDAEILKRCLDIMNELAVSFEWQKGDVLMVDNWATLHSRNSFEGERAVYASLWK